MLELRQKIYQAVYEGRQIKAKYKKRGNKFADKRHMHPLGIVIKGSMHYLICMMEEDPGVEVSLKILATSKISKSIPISFAKAGK